MNINNITLKRLLYGERSNKLKLECKACTRCGEILPRTEEYFYKMKVVTKTKGIYYTLTPRCRECTKDKVNEYIDKDREGFYEKQKLYQEANQEIRNKRAREWRENNPERNYENQSDWRITNPEKCREYSRFKLKNKIHNISLREWIACKNYFDNCCAYCGMPIEEHYYTRKGITKLGDFHKEHKNHYGNNDLSNCLPSCGSCNDRKWKFDFDSWYNETNPRYSKERYDKIIKWLTEDYKLYFEEKKPRRKYTYRSKQK